MVNNILIVDDVAVNRYVIRKILSNKVKDINIIEADSGKAALEILGEGNISVIILDIVMPDINGLEVLERVKADPKFSNIPVIMCSAVNEIESVEKALSLGALDYFTKPLTEEQRRITLPLKVKNALEYYKQKNTLEEYYSHMKAEMQFAEQLQKSIISEKADFHNVKMLGKYIPCDEIGGDLFVCKAVKDKVWFMVADVIGHGISAAMVSAMLNVLFNSGINLCNNPSEILKFFNNNLFDIFNGSEQGIISSFVGCYENKVLQYSNAGHPYPVLFRKNTDSVEQLQMNGFLLGAFREAQYETNTIDICGEDMVILYTDGLFDNGTKDKFAAWDSVLKFCDKNKNYCYGEMDILIDNITNHFLQYGNNIFKDDSAVMAIKFTDGLV